jgi:hypothetical protein
MVILRILRALLTSEEYHGGKSALDPTAKFNINILDKVFNNLDLGYFSASAADVKAPVTVLATFFSGFVGWASTAPALLPAVLHEYVEIDDGLKQILKEMAHLSYSPQTEFIPGQKLVHSSDICQEFCCLEK